MNVTLAVVIGVLFAVGTSMIMHRTLTRIAIGVGLIGNAVNLLLVAAGGRAGAPPLLDAGGRPVDGIADPLPQAMALTAIVIAFGMIAFLLALAYRNWRLTGDDEVEDDVEDRRIAGLGRRGTAPDRSTAPSAQHGANARDADSDEVTG